VVSQFHPDALMKVAQAGGGRYFNVTSDEIEAEEILQDMGALNRTDFAERRYLVYEDRFQYPLAVAILLFLLELSAPIRRLRKKRGTRDLKAASGAGPVSTALLLMAIGAPTFALLFTRPAQAEPLIHGQTPLEAYLENEKGLKAYKDGKIEEAQKKFGTAQALDPNLPELEYNEGVVQLQQGDVDSAVHGFSEAGKQALKSGDQGLAARSLYNLGEALQKKGDTHGAAQAYLSAIESSQLGKDQKVEGNARKNLELLIQKRQQQKKQQKQDQDKKDQKEKDSKDSKDQKDKKDPKDQKDQGDKQMEDPSKSRRQFKSPKLTKDDAERVMAELSNRERELQSKVKKQSGTPQQMTNEKDW
jgi:Ca-activated chloride channel family protein